MLNSETNHTGWCWTDAAAAQVAEISISFASTRVAGKRDSANLLVVKRKLREHAAIYIFIILELPSPKQEPEGGLQVPNQPNEHIFRGCGRKLEQLEKTHAGRGGERAQAACATF